MKGDKWTAKYSATHEHPRSCGLCGARRTVRRIPISGSTVLVWDHCHDHNIVRGSLCRGCNVNEGSDRVGGWAGDMFTAWRARCPECVAGEPSRDPAAARVWLSRENLRTGKTQRGFEEWIARFEDAEAMEDEEQSVALWWEVRAGQANERRLEEQAWSVRWEAVCAQHKGDWSKTREVRRQLAAQWEVEYPGWEATWAVGRPDRDARWAAGRPARDALWATRWAAGGSPAGMPTVFYVAAVKARKAVRLARLAEYAALEASQAAQEKLRQEAQEEKAKARARTRRVELRRTRAKLAARAERELTSEVVARG